MSIVMCPDCGANYEGDAVANVATFACAVCGGVLAGGLADGAASETAAPAPAPRAAARRATAPRRKAAASAPPKGVLIGGAALVVVAAVAVFAMQGGGSAPPAPAAAPVPATPAADPMTDVAAWTALPEAERARRAESYVTTAEVSGQAAIRRATAFLTERGETKALQGFARRVLDRDPADAWARGVLGHADLAAEADGCLRECEQADEANDEQYVALREERAKHPGSPWWCGDADLTRVRGLVAGVREAEKRYSDPYQSGVAKWVRRQRAVDIMKDNPALHAAVGPYVIFVSLNVTRDPKDPTRDVTMAQVTKEELARGEKILARNEKVFAAFYDGWMTEVAPHFGMTRYGPENSDFKLLLKANVFAKPEDFMAYNVKSEAGIGGFTRAYYSAEEPRFITTYDGGDDEDDSHADQVQCHEATHQLVHFYTWDLTRKDLGREPDWLEVHGRPLWSGEGFAEFFSSHRVVDGKYVWMQPLDSRMSQMWVFEEMVKEKGWTPWRLREFFYTLHHGGTLSQLGRARAKTNDDEWMAEGVMANLFYAKAWSFVYFLWYAEDGGKPKYRDRYLAYLTREFHVKFTKDAATGKERPAPARSAALMECLGVDGDAELDALEKEWNAFTAKLLAEHRKPTWDAERRKMRRNFGFDKAPADGK